jgi:hypothetical protein
MPGGGGGGGERWWWGGEGPTGGEGVDGWSFDSSKIPEWRKDHILKKALRFFLLLSQVLAAGRPWTDRLDKDKE